MHVDMCLLLFIAHYWLYVDVCFVRRGPVCVAFTPTAAPYNRQA